MESQKPEPSSAKNVHPTSAAAQSSEELLRMLCRLVGYALLALVFLDVVDIFVPLKFSNANWEFQLVGNLVERVPVPALGVLLVLYGEKKSTRIRLISIISILVGILFLLLIPLGISSTLLLNKQNNAQISTQANQQLANLQQFKKQLNNPKALKEIEQYIARINALPKKPGNNQPLTRELLAKKIPETESQINFQASAQIEAMKFSLLKRSIKWNLGALIAGVLFILLGRSRRSSNKVPFFSSV
jgi:hypothetical protein